MSGKLDGKVAAITGAASGIGLGAVERLIAEGARVIAGDVQDEKGAALETRFKGALVYRHCDVTDEAQVKALMDSGAAHFGGLDIVFNNAGVSSGAGTLAETDLDVWRKQFELLLFAVVAGVKHAVPHLKARGGGSIVNTASIAGLQAGWGPPPYSTAKAAVIHFTRTASAELARDNIRVNAICPGLIATSIIGASMGVGVARADQMAALIKQRGKAVQPIQRTGMPEDIAAMVAFLASADAAFITGQHFVVDGGITIGSRHSWEANVRSPFAELFDPPSE
jgi:NAD(P)-dependent dehydrogenase (short-subunit alcohol dehydrogenase family)